MTRRIDVQVASIGEIIFIGHQLGELSHDTPHKAVRQARMYVQLTKKGEGKDNRSKWLLDSGVWPAKVQNTGELSVDERPYQE